MAARKPLAGDPEKVNAVATPGATETLPNVDVATIHYLTLNAASCALTFPDPLAGKSFMLWLKQDGTGSRLVTWPGSVRWQDGIAPVLTTTPAKSDIFSFVCVDGTHWDGFPAGFNY